MEGLFSSEPEAADPREKRAEQDAALIAAYEAAGRTLDDLPYTPEFETLYRLVLAGTTDDRTRRDVFHRLHNLRKAGKLPRLGRSSPGGDVVVTAEEEGFLADLVKSAVGTLGQRDQLPFDDRFDGVIQAFNERTGRALTPRDVWRLVAKLAK